MSPRSTRSGAVLPPDVARADSCGGEADDTRGGEQGHMHACRLSHGGARRALEHILRRLDGSRDLVLELAAEGPLPPICVRAAERLDAGANHSTRVADPFEEIGRLPIGMHI